MFYCFYSISLVRQDRGCFPGPTSMRKLRAVESWPSRQAFLLPDHLDIWNRTPKVGVRLLFIKRVFEGGTTLVTSRTWTLLRAGEKAALPSPWCAEVTVNWEDYPVAWLHFWLCAQDRSQGRGAEACGIWPPALLTLTLNLAQNEQVLYWLKK